MADRDHDQEVEVWWRPVSHGSGITAAATAVTWDRRGEQPMPTDTDWFPADHTGGLDPDPAWPPAGPPSAGRGPLQDLRWQRQMRPRWQRISFVSVLALLFALLFDPSRVLFAGLGLAIAAILWPVLGWPGRIVSWTLAVAWTMTLVGWQHTIPLAGLAGFARWFCAASPARPTESAQAGLPAVDLAGLADGDRQAVDGWGAGGGLPPGWAPLDPPTTAGAEGLGGGWAQIAQAAGLAGTTLSPATTTPFGWTATLQLRPGQTIADAIRQREALESALDLRPRSVRLEEDPSHARQVLVRVVERDPHAAPIPWAGPQAGTIRRPLQPGVWETGDPVAVSLANQHTLIVGATGSGKSMLLNILVGELVAAGDVVCWGVDFKGGAELGPWRACLGRVATTPGDTEQLLLAAVAVLDARMGELGRRGRRELAPSPTTPALVVVIDEHAELVARCGRPALEAIDSIAKRGRAASVTLILANQRATMDLLGSEILRANLRVRFCLGVEDPGEVSLALGLGGKKDWPPELLDAPGKFYLRARSQGLNSPRPARGYLATTAQVHRLAAHHAQSPARLDAVSAQAAARHPAAHSRLGGDQPPPPPGGGHPDPAPAGPGGWTPPQGGAGDPEVARLLAVVANAGPTGLTVTELLVATGRQKTWVYDRLADLQQAALVERAGQGRYRLSRPPTGG
jgi:S-DNA-T family DNA segregation ATPase FtsK/SpoIIIE